MPAQHIEGTRERAGEGRAEDPRAGDERAAVERLHALERAAIAEERALLAAPGAAPLSDEARAVAVALAEGVASCRAALSAHLRAHLRAPLSAPPAASARTLSPAAALAEEPLSFAPHTPLPAAFAIDETPVHEYTGRGVTPPTESRAPATQPQGALDEDTPPPLPSEDSLAALVEGQGETPLPWAPTPDVTPPPHLAAALAPALRGDEAWDFPMTSGEVLGLSVPSALAQTPLPFAAPSPLPAPRADLSGARRLEASLDGDPTLEPTPTPGGGAGGEEGRAARAVASARAASPAVEAAWSALEEEGDAPLALDLGAPGRGVGALGAGLASQALSTRAQRVSLDVPVEVLTDVVRFSALCHNINDGGLFLETEVPLEVGEVVRVRLTLERSGFELDARAAVRWRRAPAEAAPGAPVGAGLSFVSLPPAARRQVEAYVASHS